MSKLSQISAEMDEENIPVEERNGALFEKVSAGLKVAEKKIDSPTTLNQSKSKLTHEDIVKLVKEYATTTHNVVTKDGKSYVKVAVWQFLASLLGLMPSFECTSNDEQTTVLCICHLYNREGREISQSTMVANDGEDFLKDKDNYAVWGMAQTRALSRAVKNVYGYIVEEAGFLSTPMEEISETK